MRDRFKKEVRITPEVERQYLDAALRVRILLNVGPNTQGRFAQASVKVLAEIGKMLQDQKTTYK
jgi:alpha-L-fucosidase